MKPKILLLWLVMMSCGVLLYGQQDPWLIKAITANDPEKQVEYLTKSLQTEGITAEKYELRGDAYFKLGLHAVYEHHGLLITFGKDAPNNDKAMYANAINDYTQALALDPKRYELYFKRGDVYWQQGRSDLKLADLTTLISLDSTNSKAWRDRGWLCRNNFQDLERSIADLSKAIDLDPWDTLACLNRAYDYAITMQCEKALADYEKVISITPGKSMGYTGRGEVYMTMFETDKAMDDFSKAIELNKNDSRAYSGRGYINLLRGKYAEALKDIDTCISRLSCRMPHIYGNKGYVLLQLDKKDEAIENLKKYTEMAEYAFNGHLNLAIAYYHKGKMKKVKKHFLLACSIKPSLSEGYDEILRLEADGRARMSSFGYYWTPEDKEILQKIFNEYR